MFSTNEIRFITHVVLKKYHVFKKILGYFIRRVHDKNSYYKAGVLILIYLEWMSFMYKDMSACLCTTQTLAL